MKGRVGGGPIRRLVPSALGLTAILVAGGVVRADAPTGQYATFGYYDTCISDNFTKLTWTRKPLAGTSLGLSFSAASSLCATLEDGGDVWRLPSVNELETLVDENPHYELEDGVLRSKAIDANAFPLTPVTYPYWTSSVVPGGGGTAWAVNFQDGSTVAEPQTLPEEVRCVIVTPAPPASMPAYCQ